MSDDLLKTPSRSAFKAFCAQVFRKESARLDAGVGIPTTPPSGGDGATIAPERRFHFHLVPELFIQVNGATEFTVPSGPFRLDSGETCVIPRRTPHFERALDAADGVPFRNLVVLASKGLPSMHLASAKGERPVVEQEWWIPADMSERINALLDECVDAAQSSHPLAHEAARHAFATLLVRLQILLDEPKDDPQNQHNWRINRCKALISNEMHDPQLKVSRLAHGLSCTPNHLSSAFKNETGATINAYISLVRIEKAKSLLRETTMSVSEIAWACGFSTPNYFIRSFKHNSGLTPARFREAAC